MLQRNNNYRPKVSCAWNIMVWRASFRLEQLETDIALNIVLLGDDMYSWILSCCIMGVTTQYSYLHIIDISCTISVTVMFIMLCNTVQATFNFTPCSTHK